ncbi:uncharacterized protein [Spinacia oleracea]|uniref:Aspartic peptidase DDI1-type domain-containing protein n=1 Tax=Spinacia oleracea TaxID=3562 RepID=A0ABM3QQG1_SPIOL|nr:uncharacterized protein LOC130461497 [Spinacia oleracea]
MHGSYQGFGQGGGYDSQGRGNYREQGYQGQAPYGQSHGLGNQTQYNQGSYNPNHQGGGGYNYPYGQYRGASSGCYPSNPGGQYGVSQFPPPGFNGPRTYGNQYPQNPMGYGNAPPTLPPLKSILEALMESFVGAQDKKNVEFEDGFKQSNTHLKMIETQLAQLASTIKEQQVHTSLQPQGQAPKQMYAVMTRSGKILDDGAMFVDAPCSRGEGSKGNESTDYDVGEEKSHIDDVSDGVKPTEATLLPLPTPPLPYPQKIFGKKLDDQLSKFLDTISKLYVSLSFTEALKQMPHYSRFTRDILCGKRTYSLKETVHLTENYSALILSLFPPKLKDLGSFSIPCSIQKLKFHNALCDLGASVSIFPCKIYAKLSLGDLTPTPMSLQLTDYSVMFPLGRVDDVPLVIGKLTFLVDFIVLDIDEDAHTPIILGRPFLATAGALIDVQGGLITLKAGDAKASFKLPIDDECGSKKKSCMKLDTIACIEHRYANISNDSCASKFDDKLARNNIKEKKVFVNSSVLGDSFDDVITIPEIFGMGLDDVRAETSAPHGKDSPVKKPKRGKHKLKGIWFDPTSMSGGLGKWFAPKGEKRSFLTCDDRKPVAFDPP